MFECILFFFVLHQVSQIIIGMVRVIYHIEALSVVIRPIFKNLQILLSHDSKNNTSLKEKKTSKSFTVFFMSMVGVFCAT